jgi:hypothetical protein
MFLLNEYRNVVITTMAAFVVLQKIAAVPVSLGTSGVTFLVESRHEDDFVRSVVDSVDNVTEDLLGCKARLKATFPGKPDKVILYDI